ncbi:DUF803 domain membrane protein [Thozetella sp. PMI_491]|nr:DUF803 domain membrane protein [Thozetella sp. PMI_491]
MAMEEKYIGLALAMASSLGIGSSSIITKISLMQAQKRYKFEGEGFVYLKSPLWWLGTATLVLGEACNFAAYAFAPAILVTPLGALSVLIAAVLGSYFLHEELGRLGKLGSAICLIGAVIIILHAPADEDIQTIDKILEYALRPGFLIYAIFVSIFSVVMMFKIAPVYGKKNPLVHVSVCSLVGSVSVMAIKAFGMAVKLTIGGNNQFRHPSTYVFMIITVFCILVQMTYLNKALSHFPTNIVNPLYFVTFTTGTICASVIFYGGFNTDTMSTISLLCGFIITFEGVYLLNLSRRDSADSKHTEGSRSDAARAETLWSIDIPRQSRGYSRISVGNAAGDDREGFIRGYEEECAGGYEPTGVSQEKRESNAADAVIGRH